MDELGEYSPAELRAGGVNSRGFLQPILPVPASLDPDEERHQAGSRLASRGLLIQVGSRWRPVGRFAHLLEAMAVARALVAIEHPGGAGLPRLTFGLVGGTSEVFDLRPQGDRYLARSLERRSAAAELAAWLGVKGGGGSADGPDEVVPDSTDRWAQVEGRLESGVTTAKVEAAVVEAPNEPLRQHRLHLIATAEDEWLLLGHRRGGQATRSAAPATAERILRVIDALLQGADAEL